MLHTLDLLNNVPVGVYAILGSVALVVCWVGGLTLICLRPGSKLGIAVLAISTGGALAFALVNLPYILPLLQDPSTTPLVKLWPWWGGGELTGTFTTSVIGVALGTLTVGLIVRRWARGEWLSR